MPRIRTVKPELLNDERIATLSDTARLLYYGLLGLVDDDGRAKAAPAYLHGAVFWGQPRSHRKIAAAIAELEAAGMIVTYTANGGQYLEIQGWNEQGSLTHQRIEHRQPSALPAPPRERPESSRGDASICSTNARGAVPRTLAAEPPPNQNQNQNQNQNREGDRDQNQGSDRDQEQSVRVLQEPDPLPSKPPDSPAPRHEQTARDLHQTTEHDRALERRQRLRVQTFDRMIQVRDRVIAELGLGASHLHPHDAEGERDLSARIVESGDHAEERCDHVLAVAEARARVERSVANLTGSLFTVKSWRFHLGMSVDDAKRLGARSARAQADSPQPRMRADALGADE